MKLVLCLLGLLMASPAAADDAWATFSASGIQLVDPQTFTPLAFDRVEESYGGFAFDPSYPTRLTVPAGAHGRFRVQAKSCGFVLTAPWWLLEIRLNGTLYIGEDKKFTSGLGTVCGDASVDLTLADGDYLELLAYHLDTGPIQAGGTIPQRANRLTVSRIASTTQREWICSGQSNAIPLCANLAIEAAAVHASVRSWGLGATPIACWDATAPCWAALQPLLGRDATAFIWFQGESDEGSTVGYYRAKLENFIGRVRAAIGKPELPVFIIQIGAYEQPPIIVPEQIAFVTNDVQATLITDTADEDWTGGYVGSIHMSPVGYQHLAARLRNLLP